MSTINKELLLEYMKLSFDEHTLKRVCDELSGAIDAANKRIEEAKVGGFEEFAEAVIQEWLHVWRRGATGSAISDTYGG